MALEPIYGVPVLQILASVAILQVVAGGSPVTKFAAEKISKLTDELRNAAKKVVYDSPVIAITAGLTYLVQEFATRKIPSLSLSMQGCTSLKVALYIAGVFAARSALSLYLERAINDHKKKNPEDDTIVKHLHHGVIRNVVPIAAACTAAYYTEVPLKLAKTALYSAALVPVVKLLGKGLESFMNSGPVKAVAENVIKLMK